MILLLMQSEKWWKRVDCQKCQLLCFSSLPDPSGEGSVMAADSSLNRSNVHVSQSGSMRENSGPCVR